MTQTLKDGMKGIFMILFIALLLISCKQQDQEVKVGFIAPLSGPLSNFGQDIKEGVSLFEKDHSDISVVYEDDTFDPKESITAYRKLRDIDNMTWIVGPFGPTSTSTIYGVMSDADKKDSVMASITLCVDEFEDYENVICSYPSLRNQIAHALNFADGETFYIVTETSALGEIFIQFSEELAHEKKIKGIAKIDFATETTFYTYATKIKSLTPDFVYIGSSNPASNFQFVRALKEQDVRIPILIASDLEEEQLEQFKDILEGVYFTGFLRDEYSTDFMDGFIQTYGKEPNLYNALGYELVAAVYASEKKGNIGKQALVAEINENDFAIKGFTYENYTAIIPLEVKQVIDGQLVPVE